MGAANRRQRGRGVAAPARLGTVKTAAAQTGARPTRCWLMRHPTLRQRFHQAGTRLCRAAKASAASRWCDCAPRPTGLGPKSGPSPVANPQKTHVVVQLKLKLFDPSKGVDYAV